MADAEAPPEHAAAQSRKKGTKRTNRWTAVEAASAAAAQATDGGSGQPPPPPPASSVDATPPGASGTRGPPARPKKAPRVEVPQAVSSSAPPPQTPPSQQSAEAKTGGADVALADEVPNASLDQFGDFDVVAAELYTAYAPGPSAGNPPASTAPTTDAAPRVGARPRAAFWARAERECAAAAAAGHPIQNWGELRMQPWATSVDVALTRFVARLLPAMVPFVSVTAFTSRMTALVNALPVFLAAPLLPLLQLLNDPRVLGTAYRHTISDRLRAFAGFRDDADLDYEIVEIGLVHPRRATPPCPAEEGPFGIIMRGGMRHQASWTSPNAAIRYAEYNGIPTVGVATTAAAARLDLVPAGVGAPAAAAAPQPARFPSPSEWKAYCARVCKALHRLAAALAISDAGVHLGPDGAPRGGVALNEVAMSAGRAYALLQQQITTTLEAAYAEIRRTTEPTATAAATLPRRLASIWNTIHLDARITQMRARMDVPTTDLPPVEDASADARRVGDLFAELRPLLTALRGATLILETQKTAERLVVPLQGVMQQLRNGSVAVRAQLDAHIRDARHSFDLARERSTLVPTTLANGAIVPVTEITTVALVTQHRDRVARAAAILDELAGCHPALLSASMCDILEDARYPSRMEREAMEQTWGDYAHAAHLLHMGVRDLIFSFPDATFLAEPAKDLPDLWRPAATGPSKSLREEFSALVAQYVERCRRARDTAARASPSAPAAAAPKPSAPSSARVSLMDS